MRAYLSESERRRRYFVFRIKLYTVAAFAVFLGIAGTYAIRNSGFFNLHGIEIIGLSENGKEELLSDFRAEMFRRSATRFFGSDNYFSWPDSLEKFSAVYQVTGVQKNIFSRTIRISASPRDRFAAWCPASPSPNQTCRWIDGADAIFLDATPMPVGQLLLTIIESTDRVPMPGDLFLEAVEFDRLKRILTYVKGANLSIQSIELNRTLEEIHITTLHGALLRFSLRFDPAVNLAGFREMIAKVPMSQIRELNLTVPGKIYLTRI